MKAIARGFKPFCLFTLGIGLAALVIGPLFVPWKAKPTKEPNAVQIDKRQAGEIRRKIQELWSARKGDLAATNKPSLMDKGAYVSPET